MTDSANEVDEAMLARAPCWVFRVVAEADGKVDRRERKRLQELLRERQAFTTDWMKTALAKAEENLDTVMAEIDRDPNRVKSELRALADQAEQRLSEQEARAFKHDLLSLGKTIAEASGGVLGFGEKIDDTEKEALSLLISVLRYETS